MNEKRMDSSRGLFITNTILTLTVLFNFLIFFDISELLVLFIFLAIGLFLAFFRLDDTNYHLNGSVQQFTR
jgi:hypothetical protein